MPVGSCIFQHIVQPSACLAFTSLSRRSGCALFVVAALSLRVGLPRKQKIAVNKFWVQESEIGEECQHSGREFWA